MVFESNVNQAGKDVIIVIVPDAPAEAGGVIEPY